MNAMRNVSIAVVALMLATSAFAHSHAVRPVAEAVYAGLILDSATNKPVVEAEVTSGNRTVKTDAAGSFNIVIITGRPVALIVHRSGYEDLPLTVTLTNQGSVSPVVPVTPAPVTLTPKPLVIVKTTAGATIKLDADTVQLAYVIPFSNPATSTVASFCRVDGTADDIDRTEFAHITGPAVSTTNSACCKLGPALAIDVELKTGEKERVLFTDSCFGYDCIFTGRDHDSAQFVQVKFTEIASIDFP